MNSIDHEPEPELGTPEGAAYFQKMCDERDMRRGWCWYLPKEGQTTDSTTVSAFLEEVQQAYLSTETDLPSFIFNHRTGDIALYSDPKSASH